jgi:Domain of unknown function (DUF4367)
VPINIKPTILHSEQPDKSWQVNVIWHTPESYVTLSVSPHGANQAFATGQAQLKEIKINGKPAILVKDIWVLGQDADSKSTGKLVPSTGKLLICQIGNLDYKISASGNISDEDLINMAESIR